MDGCFSTGEREGFGAEVEEVMCSPWLWFQHGPTATPAIPVMLLTQHAAMPLNSCWSVMSHPLKSGSGATFSIVIPQLGLGYCQRILSGHCPIFASFFANHNQLSQMSANNSTHIMVQKTNYHPPLRLFWNIIFSWLLKESGECGKCFINFEKT